MSEQRNPLAWPSIEQLPRVVADRVNRFLIVADNAAIIIQRAHRGIKPTGRADLRGGRLFRLYELLLGSAVTAGEKYDGTNVGAMRDGTLLGRRLIIDATATSYQKAPLGSLRALDTAGVLDELVACGGASAKLRHAALYGELCCNIGIYTYELRGLAKTWQAFGALLEFKDPMAAMEYAREASGSGVLCISEEMSATVRVCNNETFVNMARRHNVPVVSVERYPSLCEAVASRQQWMMGEHGEGLVLSVARGTGELGRGRASSYKWKISREPQPAAIQLLTDLMQELSTGAGGKGVLLDAPIHTMIATLLAVTTHADSTTLAAASAAAQPAKQPKGKPAVLDASAVQTALESALSKFDALEVCLEANGQAGATRFAEQLVTEMVGDAELALPAEGDARREAAIKEVTTAVKRYVGQQFGAWKKTRAAGAAASA